MTPAGEGVDYKGTRNYNADVNLSAGTHNVRVEYFEAVGYAMIMLEIGAVERLVDLCRDAGHVGVALVEALEDVLDVLLHRLGGDPLRGRILVPTRSGHVERELHTHDVGERPGQRPGF